MVRKPGTILCLLMLLAAYGGCATVNPRPDYDQAAQYVTGGDPTGIV